MSIELIQAIRSGDVTLVRELLSGGADPNFHLPAESDHGVFLDQVTPLMVAVAAPGSTAEIVRLLLTNGADPFDVSTGGVTATWYASGGGTGYPLTDENIKSLEPDHPFWHWGGGDVERLRLILDAGGDPNEFETRSGRSCVFEACSVGDPERLKLLIERGASVEPACPPSSLPHVPVNFSKQMAKALEKMASGWLFQSVPLFAASSAGSVECVKLILEAGFPADYDVAGDNALKEVGSSEVAEFLWNQGVRIEADDNFGFDAIDEAIESDNMPVLQFLLSKADAATLQEKLWMASGVRMNPRAVRLLLEMGADASFVDERSGHPLFSACWQGDGNCGRETSVVDETIQILIDAGSDPNQFLGGGFPLHEAVFGDWGSPTAVLALLRNGADINAVDEDGQTPLMVAAERGEVDCVRVLLEKGADKSIRDKRGKTALHYAQAQLKTWKKPRSRFFHKKMDKLLGYPGYDSSETSRSILDQAQQVVDLLNK